ncbi:pyridoxal phosphate-dependent aminotransferase [Chloroflexota bacterium]
MPVSNKILAAMQAGSMIRRMFEEGAKLKQQYGAENVFDLSLGNPIVEPPPEFEEELRRLAANPLAGMHRYMENAGYPETREAVGRELQKESGIGYSCADVIMTCGAAGAMNIALKALLDPGDEVIVFAPYFVEYLFYVDNHQGKARVVPTDATFLPDMTVLEAAITGKTRAVIINSPNNPTGAVYSDGLLSEMADVLRRKSRELGTEIYIISDEPYRRIVFDGLKYAFPAVYYNRTIIVASHSKDLALPGERIGYLALHPDCPGKEDLINGFIYCNRTLGFVNAPALMQLLVRNIQGASVSIEEYQRKRDLIYTELVKYGYKVVKPAGAFYFFPRSPLADDKQFISELHQHRVLAVPGAGFGVPGYFRLVFCTDDHTIRGGLEGLARMAEKYRLGKS